MTMLLLLILATWRLSSLLTREDGPYMILRKLRYYLGVRYDNMSEEPYGANELGRGVLCLWCNSVWVAAVLSFAALAMGIFPFYMLPFMVFAISAGAILVDEVIS